jgi:hypothetical protein
MLKKLRNESLLNELRCIFYSLDIDLNKALGRILEYEDYGKFNKNKFEKRFVNNVDKKYNKFDKS